MPRNNNIGACYTEPMPNLATMSRALIEEEIGSLNQFVQPDYTVDRNNALVLWGPPDDLVTWLRSLPGTARITVTNGNAHFSFRKPSSSLSMGAASVKGTLGGMAAVALRPAKVLARVTRHSGIGSGLSAVFNKGEEDHNPWRNASFVYRKEMRDAYSGISADAVVQVACDASNDLWQQADQGGVSNTNVPLTMLARIIADEFGLRL
jgi:hypothetical protein